MSYTNITAAASPQGAPSSPARFPVINRKRGPNALSTPERKNGGDGSLYSSRDTPPSITFLPSSPGHFDMSHSMDYLQSANNDSGIKRTFNDVRHIQPELEDELEEGEYHQDKKVAVKATQTFGHAGLAVLPQTISEAAAASSSSSAAAEAAADPSSRTLLAQASSLASQQIQRKVLNATARSAKELLTTAFQQALTECPRLNMFAAAYLPRYILSKNVVQLERFIPSSNGKAESSNRRDVIINAQTLELNYRLKDPNIWPEMELVSRLTQQMTDVNKESANRWGYGLKFFPLDAIAAHAQARILLHYHACQLFQGTAAFIGGRGETNFQLFKGLEAQGTVACHHSVLANIREGQPTLLNQFRDRIIRHLAEVKAGRQKLDGKLMFLMLALGVPLKEIEGLVDSTLVGSKEEPQKAVNDLWVNNRLNTAAAMDTSTLFYYMNNHTLVTKKFVNYTDDAIEKEVRRGVVNDIITAASRGGKPVELALALGKHIQGFLRDLHSQSEGMLRHFEAMDRHWAEYDKLWTTGQPVTIEAKVKRLQGIEQTFSGVISHAEEYNRILQNSAHMEDYKQLRPLPVDQWRRCLLMDTEFKKFSNDLKVLETHWQAYQNQESEFQQTSGRILRLIGEFEEILEKLKGTASCTVSEAELQVIKNGTAQNKWSWTAYMDGKYDKLGLFRKPEFILWRNACIKDISAKKGNAYKGIEAAKDKLAAEISILSDEIQQMEDAKRRSAITVNFKHHLETLETYFKDRVAPAIAQETTNNQGLSLKPVTKAELEKEAETIAAQIQGTQAAVDYLTSRRDQLLKETPEQVLEAQIILASRFIDPVFVPPK